MPLIILLLSLLLTVGVHGLGRNGSLYAFVFLSVKQKAYIIPLW